MKEGINMTTYKTIKEVIALTPEQIAEMTVEEMEQLIQVLHTSKSKPARMKLDQIKSLLKKHKADAKTEEEKKKIASVENSVKKGAQKTDEKEGAETPEEILNKISIFKLKSIAKAQGIDFLPKTAKKAEIINALLYNGYVPEQETEQKDAPKSEEKEGKALTTEQALAKEIASLKKKLKEKEDLERQNEGEIFPNELETKGSAKLVKIEVKELSDLQENLLENPFQIYMQAYEGLRTKATTYLVTYASDELVLCVEKSGKEESVLPLDTETVNFEDGHCSIDNFRCPMRFYKIEKPVEEEEGE